MAIPSGNNGLSHRFEKWLKWTDTSWLALEYTSVDSPSRGETDSKILATSSKSVRFQQIRHSSDITLTHDSALSTTGWISSEWIFQKAFSPWRIHLTTRLHEEYSSHLL